MAVTDQIDLSDLDLFQHGEPWDQFTVLRREAPVHWNPEPAPNSGFWSLTRHADIVAINGDPQRFTSMHFTNLEEVDPGLRALRRSMLECDGSRHRGLRTLLAPAFTPATLLSYEPTIRAATEQALDAAMNAAARTATGEFDFVAVATEIPGRVSARLLGVPDQDIPRFTEWSNRLIGNTDPHYADVVLGEGDDTQYRHLPFRSPAALEVFAYGRALAQQRRAGTGDGTDLVSRLVHGTPQDGHPVTDNEFDTNFLMLVAASNETTRHSLAFALLGLLTYPTQARLVLDHPDLVPTAVEELLRWASPVYHFRRTATVDIELHGQQIRAGDKVVMWFASGNRDEEVFTRPSEVDVTRHPNPHLVFGRGPHYCLGAALARMELRVMVETLLPRLPNLTLAGPPRFWRSNWVRGIHRLPVRVRARGAL